MEDILASKLVSLSRRMSTSPDASAPDNTSISLPVGGNAGIMDSNSGKTPLLFTYFCIAHVKVPHSLT